MEVLQRTANRGSIATGGYDIDNSLKFEQDNSEAMTRTATASQGGNRKTWTWSGWIKRTELGRHMYLFSAGGTGLQILSSDNIRFSLYYNNTSYYLDLNAKLRDTSAWYHIVGQLDTTQSTAEDRVKVWINGERQTSFSNDSAHNIPQNADVQHLNEATGTSTGWMKICDWYASGRFFSGYTADWHFTDGVANNPTEFGEFDDNSGIWKPKAYTGSYGTNGFYLDFEDNTSAGKDTSGNNNNFSDTNLNAADHATDTPTNNFATISVTAQYTDSARIINQSNITNGATKITKTDVGAWGGGVGTMGVKSGKWYYEGKIYDIDDLMLGFSTFSGNIGANASPHGIGTNIVYYGGGASGSYWFYHVDGTTTSNSSNRGTVWSVGDIIGIALDLDNSKANFYVNGSLAGSNNTNVDISDVTDEINSTGDFLVPFTGMWRSTIEFNFGGYTVTSISSAASDENGYGTFEYAPPSGYYALCTKNLAEYG